MDFFSPKIIKNEICPAMFLYQDDRVVCVQLFLSHMIQDFALSKSSVYNNKESALSKILWHCFFLALFQGWGRRGQQRVIIV